LRSESVDPKRNESEPIPVGNPECRLDLVVLKSAEREKNGRARMMGVSGELYRAVLGLRQAAEAGLPGNSYYQAANRITHLIEIVGQAEENAAPSEDSAYDFATMLAEVRKGVQSHLSGNRYYLAINKLEELAFFAMPAAQTPAQRGSSFEELAAASKARVEAIAVSLGIVTARQAPPLHAQFAETLADGELERRSSEPCLMAELAPPALEPVAPASIFAEAAAPAPFDKAAENLGSPAAQGEHSPVQGAISSAAAAYPAAAPAFQPSAPAYDRAAASAGETVGAAPIPAAGQEIQVKEPDEFKRKQPKTLFKLWLDLAFGRKD
jgi:hypothetical protein